jgi:hypothetical protein
MSTSEIRWFEVWFDQGDDSLPAWLLVVTPDKENPGMVLVCDPQEGYRTIHCGQNYKDTQLWLQEDEYSLVGERVFPDDGLPFLVKQSS